MEADAAPFAPCRNCGAVPVPQTPPPHFCAQCGQERTLHPPTLREFLHEFIGHYVALEGALWRSLALLLGRPGRLTREYLEGRRRRYVLPLRLYLTASFVFFVVIKLIPSEVGEVVKVNGEPTPAAAVIASAARSGMAASTARADAAASGAAVAEGLPARRTRAGVSTSGNADLPALQISDCDAPGHTGCTRTERWVNGLLRRAGNDPEAFVEHLKAHALAIAPYGIFLLLPVFTALMMLAYRGRRLTYGEHFVFSLHLHAFWFIALLAMALLPKDLSDLVLLAIPVYGVMAMRTVYDGGWAATIARAAGITVLYGAALSAATAALFVALLSTG
jgi:hypothetical protein